MSKEQPSFYLQIEVNEEYVRSELARQIEEKSRAEILFLDLDELERITSMDRSFLSQTLLKDPRILQHQRRHGPRGKRYWLYKPTVEAILDIVTNEWDT